MNPRSFLLGLMTGLLSCAYLNDEKDEPVVIETSSEVIRVRLSPELSTWQVSAEAACASWSELVKPTRFVVSVDLESSKLRPPRKTIDVINYSRPGGTDSAVYAVIDIDETAPDRAVLFVFASEVQDEVKHWLMLHELGHYLGLGHDLSREHESIMWPRVTLPAKIGCEDWRRVCALRGCTARCEGGGFAIP